MRRLSQMTQGAWCPLHNKQFKICITSFYGLFKVIFTICNVSMANLMNDSWLLTILLCRVRRLSHDMRQTKHPISQTFQKLFSFQMQIHKQEWTPHSPDNFCFVKSHFNFRLVWCSLKCELLSQHHFEKEHSPRIGLCT